MYLVPNVFDSTATCTTEREVERVASDRPTGEGEYQAKLHRKTVSRGKRNLETGTSANLQGGRIGAGTGSYWSWWKTLYMSEFWTLELGLPLDVCSG